MSSGKICWDFPLLGTGNQGGSNIAAITMFKGAGVMDGLAREACQNSLDARDKSLMNRPVKVKFELTHINKNDYAMLNEYENIISDCRKYWETSCLKTEKIMSFILSIHRVLESKSIPVLVIRDYNTTGLNGSNDLTDKWNLLVNTDGISMKQDEISAGSFGIGKNAPFAYSDLNLVFYNTLAKDGGRALEGVSRLVTTTRNVNGKKMLTQPIGKYLFLEDDFSGRPIFPTDNSPLSSISIFDRKEEEIGTDVAVFGFKEQDFPDWEDNLAASLIYNFILAIKDSKLEIEIKSEKKTHQICSENLRKYIFEDFSDRTEMQYAKQILRTIEESDKCVSVTISEENDMTIYAKYSDTFIQSLSRFRSTGMLINTTIETLPHFSVVIVVNDVGAMDLSKTLREAEPPQHTEWKAKNITDNTELRKKAQRYIKQIGEEIKTVLDSFDQISPSEKIDSGIGNYLPDMTVESSLGVGNDGLKTDVKIDKIFDGNGRVIFGFQHSSGGDAEGNTTDRTAVKNGKRKRKIKIRKKIVVVKPGEGTKKGVSEGEGKVKIVSLQFEDHRTFFLGANRYRLFISSPDNFSKVFIQYKAAREDDNSDNVIIKTAKFEDRPLMNVNNETIGPVSIKKGNNIVYLEFENHEIMAVTPSFSMEGTK